MSVSLIKLVGPSNSIRRVGACGRRTGIVAGIRTLEMEQARMGKVAWLAHAADASEDGSRKLDQAWRVGEEAEGSGLRGVTLPLDRAALSVALGRDNVVHLALTDQAAAERLSGPLQRLLRYLGSNEAEATGTDEGLQPADSAAPPAMTTDLDRRA